MKNVTIKRRLISMFFLLAVIPVLIITAVIPSYMRKNEYDRIVSSQKSMLKAYGHILEVYFSELDRITLLPQINNDILNAMRLIGKRDYTEMEDKLKVYINRTMNGDFTFYMQSMRSDIKNTILVSRSGEAFASSASGSASTMRDFDYGTMEWYARAEEANGKAVFSGIHAQSYLEKGDDSHVFTVSRAVIDINNQEFLGVVCACADAAVLTEMIADANSGIDGVDSAVLITDSDGNIVAGPEELDTLDVEEVLQATSEVKVHGNKYYPAYYTLDNIGWNMIGLVSKMSIEEKVHLYYILGAFVSVVSVLFMWLLYRYYVQKISHPLMEMIEVVHCVKNKDFTARCKINNHDEITDLSKEINSMIEQLDILINREYVAKLNQRNAEYYALQAQIQPHFLNNTLAGFIGLNRMGEREKLEQAIISLKNLMLYAQVQKNDARVIEEVQMLEEYLNLQKMRFRDRMNTAIVVEKEAEDYLIPKFLLQPLVENAVIHGVEPEKKKCVVCVKAKMDEDGALILVVADNGSGFEIEQAQYKEHIGIHNVEQRLIHFYPNASMRISGKKGNGTIVTITIPKKDLKNEIHNS